MFARVNIPSLVAIASLLCALAITAMPAQAGLVRMTAEQQDLPDAPGGVDRWSNHYVVTLETGLSAFYLVSVLFDPQWYSDLTVLSPQRADIDALVVQPDAALAADGLVQFTALEALNAGQAFQFDVAYTRVATPGSAQRYEVLDAGFEFVDGGEVTAAQAPGTALPEPAALALAAAALAALAWQRRRSATS
jgi:hypothetical protein